MNGAQVGLLSPSWSRTFRAAAEVQAWRPEPPPCSLPLPLCVPRQLKPALSARPPLGKLSLPCASVCARLLKNKMEGKWQRQEERRRRRRRSTASETKTTRWASRVDVGTCTLATEGESLFMAPNYHYIRAQLFKLQLFY